MRSRHAGTKARRGTAGGAHARGAVMVLTLLAMLLLAALLFYVLNLGRQVNDRVVTQHSADAAGVAGAGFVARSLNTVARNNVGIARQIAAAHVLDAVPMAVDFTLKDQRALLEALSDQLQGGNGRTPFPASLDWAESQFQAMATVVTGEVALLEPIDTFFVARMSQIYSENNPSEAGPVQTPVGDLTQPVFTYRVDGGDRRTRPGKMWNAIHALDEYSQTVLENLGELAQVNATVGGEANLRVDDDNVVAFMAPGDIGRLPWHQGVFRRFERPVMYGLLPTDVDDATTNRGPYDAVFGWREFATEGAHWVAGSNDIVGGGAPGVNLGQQPISDGSWVGGERVAYSVHGPFGHLLRGLGGFAQSHLRYSRFTGGVRGWSSSRGYWVSRLANGKINVLWGTGAGALTAVDPDWITHYPAAVSRAQQSPADVVETAFVVLQLKSRYPRTSPQFLSDGSWAYEHAPGQPVIRVVSTSGWTDPARWGIPAVAYNLWRDQWQYQVNFDYQIGIAPQFDAYNDPIPQDVHRVDIYMFVGINVGDEVPVSAPADHLPADGFNGLPGPIDLVQSQLHHNDDEARRNYLTYLAVAQRGDRALLWPSRFRGNKPYANMVAVAQVKVFNDHSWDLWTPMWQSKLEPVSDYADWLVRVDATSAQMPLVPEAAALDVLAYLQSVEPLADVALHH